MRAQCASLAASSVSMSENQVMFNPRSKCFHTFELGLAQWLYFPIARPDWTFRKGALGIHRCDSSKTDHESRLAHLRRRRFTGRPICRRRRGCSHRRRLWRSICEVALDVSGVGLASKAAELDKALRPDIVVTRQFYPVIYKEGKK